jgi:hypothetical protein
MTNEDGSKQEPGSDNSLVWKIAGGIVLGLMLWNLIQVWQYNRVMKAHNAAIERLFNPAEQRRLAAERFPQFEQARQENARKQEAQRVDRSRAVEATAIQPGQRCISGQRFERVVNGWEQVGSC